MINSGLHQTCRNCSQPICATAEPGSTKPTAEEVGRHALWDRRVNSKLANCIKVAEITLQNKEQKSGEESAGELVRHTPGLFGWDRLSPGYLRALHQNLLTLEL